MASAAGHSPCNRSLRPWAKRSVACDGGSARAAIARAKLAAKAATAHRLGPRGAKRVTARRSDPARPVQARRSAPDRPSGSKGDDWVGQKAEVIRRPENRWALSLAAGESLGRASGRRSARTPWQAGWMPRDPAARWVQEFLSFERRESAALLDAT